MENLSNLVNEMAAFDLAKENAKQEHVVVVACSRATLAMALPSVRTLFLPSSFGTFLI